MVSVVSRGRFTKHQLESNPSRHETTKVTKTGAALEELPARWSEPSIQQTPVSRLTTKLGERERGEQLTVKSSICEGGGRGQGFRWAGTLAAGTGGQSPRKVQEGTVQLRSPVWLSAHPVRPGALGREKTFTGNK